MLASLHCCCPSFVATLCFRILESAHSGFTISFNNSYLIGGFGVWISRIPWYAYLTLFFTSPQFIVQGSSGICSPLVHSPKDCWTIIQVSLEIAMSLNSVHNTRIFHIPGFPVQYHIHCEPVIICTTCSKDLLGFFTWRVWVCKWSGVSLVCKNLDCCCSLQEGLGCVLAGGLSVYLQSIIGLNRW